MIAKKRGAAQSRPSTLGTRPRSAHSADRRLLPRRRKNFSIPARHSCVCQSPDSLANLQKGRGASNDGFDGRADRDHYFTSGHSEEVCDSIHPKMDGDGRKVLSCFRQYRRPGQSYCYVVNCATSSLGSSGRCSGHRKQATRRGKTARGFRDLGMPQLPLNESPID